MPLTPELLRRYKNEYFVETGTYLGDGVKAALAAGFDHIASIEVMEELFRINRKTFRENENVQLFLGNSEAILSEVMRKITNPITFWLDAHYSGGATGEGTSHCSAIEELEIIRRHPIKTHTILIDDIRLFGKNYVLHDDLRALTEKQRKQFLFEDVDVKDVQEVIRKINPEYQFSFEDGHTKADILAAFVVKKK